MFSVLNGELRVIDGAQLVADDDEQVSTQETAEIYVRKPIEKRDQEPTRPFDENNVVARGQSGAGYGDHACVNPAAFALRRHSRCEWIAEPVRADRCGLRFTPREVRQAARVGGDQFAAGSSGAPGLGWFQHPDPGTTSPQGGAETARHRGLANPRVGTGYEDDLVGHLLVKRRALPSR